MVTILLQTVGDNSEKTLQTTKLLSMTETIFFVIVIVIIAIFLISYLFSKKAIVKRKLKNAEFKSIGDFKDGEMAKIIGNVEFVNKPLISPLSNRRCSYYYIHIEQQVSSGENRRWKTIIEEEVSSKFLIREGGNFAFINDNNLKCYIVQDKSFSSGFCNDATENLEKFLNNKGYKSEGFLGLNKTLRYKEGILEREEKIAVFGKGIWKDVTTLELPEKYEKVLEITSNEGIAIYLSDDPDTTLKNAKKNNFLMKNRKRSHKQRYIKRY